MAGRRAITERKEPRLVVWSLGGVCGIARGIKKPGAGFSLLLGLVPTQRHIGRERTDYFRGAACVSRS